MKEINYATVMQVCSTWDKFKSADQTGAGQTIFLRLLELEPKARSMFKLAPDESAGSSPQFEAHARTIFDMIDLIVCMLGPDLDPLVDDLYDLGRRHVKHGVPMAYLYIMERSVIDSMSKLLGVTYTEADREAWRVIFQFLTTHMIRGMMAAGGV
jgi:hemoglobin-like flavoprotein